jgi:hypothetical protein
MAADAQRVVMTRTLKTIPRVSKTVMHHHGMSLLPSSSSLSCEVIVTRLNDFSQPVGCALLGDLRCEIVKNGTEKV